MYEEFPFPVRKIIHVDMDAFYASVEQMDNPELRGKPLAVGGNEVRGVVSAASYEARRFGVRSAMSGIIAARKCPHLIFVPPRFDRYKEISQQIRAVFHEFTDLVEPLSLDEAFLEVTGLNASAGISINKFVAKVASDINKPNGQKTIPPEEVLAFLETLPIEKFFGVGKVTADRMNKHGIFNGADLKKRSLEYLSLYFGKSGKHYYDIVRGIQYSEVVPDRLRKSIAAERTFSSDLSSSYFMIEQLDKIADELEKRLVRNNVKGKTITVKLKFSDFTQQTRSKTVPLFVNRKADFFPVVEELMEQEPLKGAVRLLGISMTKLDSEEGSKSVSAQLMLDF